MEERSYDRAELRIPMSEWYTDKLFVNTTVHLTLRDRLRVLRRGRLEVQTVTAMEHRPGRVETTSRVIVPRVLPHREWGYMEEGRS